MNDEGNLIFVLIVGLGICFLAILGFVAWSDYAVEMARIEAGCLAPMGER